MLNRWTKFLPLSCVLLFSIWAQVAVADISAKDPYERFNRHAFALNQTVDKVVYKPIATIYKTALPTVAQRGVTNAFNNVDDLTVIANDLLQLKIYQGTQDVWRVFFNTTFGIVGLFDVASQIGLPDHNNDFGMTLAHWGYKNTNYFVIPFLGPSSVRDTYGLATDLEVLSIYPYIHSRRARYELFGLNLIQMRAGVLKMQKLIDEASVDPYVFQRDAYLQHRNYLLAKSFNESDDNPMADTGKDPYVAE